MQIISNVHNHKGDIVNTKTVMNTGTSGSTDVLKKLEHIQGGIADLKATSNDILVATAKKANPPSGERFKAGDENLAQDFDYSTPAPRHLHFETSQGAPPTFQSFASGVSSQPRKL